MPFGSPPPLTVSDGCIIRAGICLIKELPLACCKLSTIYFLHFEYHCPNSDPLLYKYHLSRLRQDPFRNNRMRIFSR
ncbi:hypothetical protein BpHYR1_007666 [Brachionus plicatilis]|uniref:Uncharacterized protein n=1 Tax=Brachionus plicatilis TaxID=10195 RepID=A0A3M7SJU2_BRAPC|nr:hypothetical protein BpHYR1_007666 [Brachionus plicatilis]